MGTSVETSGLTRNFGEARAVDRLTLDVKPGEVLALLGPNGAGKTTTIRMLNGVLAPDEGWSRVLGLDPVVDGDAIRRRTGVLTENAGLDERLTARENLEYSARIRGMSRADATRRSMEVLEQFGMADRADDLVQGASTGQRKRVALGRALLHDPEVLFLDEPTSGLDPTATREVLELIGRLAQEGRTIILCTHFLGEAGGLAHRMAVMQRGRLQAIGTPAELAATLWVGAEVDLELARGGPDEALDSLAGQPGVLAVTRTPQGARVHVSERPVIGAVVSYLVGQGVVVYAAIPRDATLEDVYFEIERRSDPSAVEASEAPA
jgi:ABC-2 type transport system ATP-binding protein